MNKVPLPPSETELVSLESLVSPAKSKATQGAGKPPVHSNTKRETSPTSVLSHAISKNAKKRTPQVTMSDEGAEVSLSTPPAQERPPLADCTNVAPPSISPENTRRFVHMNSLLDIDVSPEATAENKEPEEPSLSASTLFCGSHGCLSPDSNDGCELVNAPQPSIERTITVLLSDPSALDLWCNAWQAWFFFGVEQHESTSGYETKEDMKRVLRNRAYDLNSRSRRIKTLKDELSPFDVTPPTVGASIPLTRTRSLGNEHISLKSSGRRWSSTSSDTSLNISVSSFWESMPGCGHADSDSPAVIRSAHPATNEDLCYDSDPEEVARDRSRSDNSTFMAFSKSSNGLVETKKEGGNLRGDFLLPRRLDAVFNDEDHAMDLVQDFMNEKQTLVWHRSAKPDAKNTGTPKATIIWIERGQQLNSGLIQPKLVWRLLRKHESQGIQRLGLSTSPSLDSLELLDISRVLEVNRIDRKLYPFAKRKCCFLVESLDRKMMFEASSEAERDRIVHGLKLTIARFASKIIVQDRLVLEEFFTSFLSAVPGEAPRWAQESNNLSLL